MRLEDFDYDLPPSLIAQVPAVERSSSRLMVVQRATGAIEHRCFSDIHGLLPAHHLLVLNNSRVFPARLTAYKETGGRIEVLLLRPLGPDLWEVLLRPTRKVRSGERLIFEKGIVEAVLQTSGDRFSRQLRFEGRGDVKEWAWAHGQMPLPPYIRRSAGDNAQDRQRYQTVYATVEGSVAAPTAGLHFTEQLLERIPHVFVTLHVGFATFQPVRVSDVREHQMQTEYFEVSPDAAARIGSHLRSGGKLVAVGSTSTRVLEDLFLHHSEIRPGKGETDLFIYPGFEFQVVDALVTNFHLPRSTLLMLVSAFAGSELIRRCYQEAIEREYRFYSYGDAMLIL